jgi:type II secretory pathway pseudopilin PulG
VKMNNRNSTSGFSILELLVSILVMGIMVIAALSEMQPTIQQMHANSAAYQLEGQLRLARQTAIADRRDVVVQFIGTDEMTLTVQDIPAGSGTILLSKVYLSPTVQYMVFAANGDTPDAFGNGESICFGSVPGCVNPPTMQFQTDGTFIDGNGNQLNGTVFVGVPNIPTSARAVTVYGATGQMHMYRATGAGWIQQ